MDRTFYSAWFACLVLVSLIVVMAPRAEGGPAAPPAASDVKKMAEEAVDIRRDTQKITDAWATEEAELHTEIEGLQKDLDALKWKRRKIAAYIEDVEAKMTALTARDRAGQEIRMELEPLLDEQLETLRQFVDGDLPFLKEKESTRLHAVRQVLNNGDASMVEKLHTLLETIMQAVEYGYFVEPDEAEVTIDGKSMRVQRIAVGRLGLFALSVDGHDVWRWDRDKGQYEPAPHFARSVREAIQMAQRARLVTLVELPLGQPATLEQEVAR
jgi:hypothetical protein